MTRAHRLALGILALSLALACGGDDEESAEGTTEPTEPEAPSLPEAAPVAAGDDHTCAVNESGQAFCWGRNLDGELGDGTARNRRTPVPVRGLSEVHAIAPGRHHTCALKRDGSVWCWGRNDHGQLGDGSTEARLEPVQVAGLTDVIQITTGHDFSCALKRDGTAWCWGSGDDGRLGSGRAEDSSSAIQVANLTDAAQIAAGARHACARKDDGTLACWGADDQGQAGTPGSARENLQATPIPVLNDVTQVAAGGDNTCAVHATGRLSCWGDVYSGKIGNGQSGSDAEDVEAPFQIDGITEVQEVGVGLYQTCARVASGAVHCWGDDGYGNLGGEERGDAAAPQAVAELADAQHLAVGGYHVCVVRATGAVSCWGKSSDGQLGAAQIEDGYHAVDRIAALATLSAEAPEIATFEPDPSAEARPRPQVSIGDGYACAVRDDGHVHCWGSNHQGQLGNGSTVSHTERSVEVIGIRDAVEVRTSASYACARRANGHVACWGGIYGFDGGRDYVRSSRPMPLPNVSSAIGLATNGSDPCALEQGGTVRCLSNAQVQPVPGLEGVAQIVSGGESYCARYESGEVRCWGSNTWGQLGNGTTDRANAPVPVAGLNDATQLAFGYSHVCALRRNGQVSCWGTNRYGQIGSGPIGEGVNVLQPTVVPGLRNAVEVAAGTHNSLARLQDGSVHCWGANDHDQCGQAEQTEARTDPVVRPTRVAPGTDPALASIGAITQIDCGNNVCCTLHDTGRLACWGSSSVLGAGTFGGLIWSRSNVPRPLTQLTLVSDAATPPAPTELAPTEPAAAAPTEPAAAAPTEPAAATEQPTPSAVPARTHRQMVETAVRRAAGGCYSRLGAHGAVTVRVNLGTDGRVTTSQVVQNGTGNQEVGRCISGAMVGQRFTAPRQGSLAFDIPFSG